jgi:myosin heavy subunit
MAAVQKKYSLEEIASLKAQAKARYVAQQASLASAASMTETFQDMVDMPRLTKELLNRNVQLRFESDQIYTSVSDVLIAVSSHCEFLCARTSCHVSRCFCFSFVR